MTPFKKILHSPTRNIVNTDRYNGDYMMKRENVSQHTVDMFYILMEMVQIIEKRSPGLLTKLGFDIKKCAYNILIHDVDEAILCDIPRSLKYSNPTLTKNLKKTVDDILLKSGMSPEFLIDIHNAKNLSDIHGMFTKLVDIIQARFTIYEEFHVRNNRQFLNKMFESREVLKDFFFNIQSKESQYSELLPEIKFIIDNILEETHSVLDTRVHQVKGDS